MRHFWRVRFRLRTLLLAMLILGVSPWLVLRYLERREDQMWNALQTAKSQRDMTLVHWRRIYDRLQAGEANDAQESDARSRYFEARAQTELAVKRVRSHYGNDEKVLIKVIDQRASRKARSPLQTGSK